MAVVNNYGRVQRKGLAKGSRRFASAPRREAVAKAIATRYGLIASITKVSRPHCKVVMAKVSRRIRDTAPRCGQIAIVRNRGLRHEANVC